MHRRRVTKKYLKAYNSLYSEQMELGVCNPTPNEEKSNVGKRRRSRNDSLTEQQEQFIAHAWMAKKNIVHHHSPNGGYRDVREAAKFKRLGVSAGYPDFHIPYARKGYHALYIELKRVKGGALSAQQKWWRDFLIAGGNAWFEARGADELKKIVCEYFDLNETGK